MSDPGGLPNSNATIITEFQPERKYFGSEFGRPPGSLIHLAPVKLPRNFHGSLSFTRSDSLLSARSFFQVGGVQPAHENDYGFTADLGLWRTRPAKTPTANTSAEFSRLPAGENSA